MADLEITGLKEAAEKQVNVQGAGSIRLNDSFLAAVNRTYKQIVIEANMDIVPVYVTDTDSEISGIDDRYEYVFADGILMNLLLLGFRPAKGMERTFKQIEVQFEDGIAMIYTDIINTLQQDDDEDIIGLGSLET